MRSFSRATYPQRLVRPIWPTLRWVIFGIGAVYCVASILGLTGWPDGGDGIVSGDAYWYYYGTPYTDEHFRYSPAFYWATLPLRALPWEVFISLWTTAHLIAVAWLGPWTILLAFDDVIRGNVTTFLAVAVVVAVRRRGPWLVAWSAVLLTKVTPGVGVLVHTWRDAAIALGATGLLVVVGALINPLLWTDWIGHLQDGTSNYRTIDFLAPLPVRLAIGIALCYAARWRIWLLPVGMLFAVPGMWPSSFAILAAIPRLASLGSSRSTARGTP